MRQYLRRRRATLVDETPASAKATVRRSWPIAKRNSGDLQPDDPHFLDCVVHPVGDNDVVEAPYIVDPAGR